MDKSKKSAGALSAKKKDKEFLGEIEARRYQEGFSINQNVLNHLVGRAGRRTESIVALKTAHKVLRDLAPLLRGFRDIPWVTTTDGKQVKVTDLLAGGGLMWVADWITYWKMPANAPRDVVTAELAKRLSQISKDLTGAPDHAWVGSKLKEHFPHLSRSKRTEQGEDELSRNDADRELRNWIQKKLKRSSGSKKRIGQTRPFKSSAGFFDFPVERKVQLQSLEQLVAWLKYVAKAKKTPSSSTPKN